MVGERDSLVELKQQEDNTADMEASDHEITSTHGFMNAVIRILVAKGYPPTSLIPGWKQGDMTYDLAVVDPHTGEPLAVFELMLGSRGIVSSEPIREKIEKYKSIQAKAGVPLFILTSTQDSKTFATMQFLPLANDKDALLNAATLPPFEEVRIKTLGQKLWSVENRFAIFCRSIALFALLLLVLDYSTIFTVTPERLALIGVIIAMVLLPFLRKIKVLGVEIERSNVDDKKVDA